MATKVAEATGEEGDKVVKRVLGHSDQSVTAIYNRYAYVKEVRRVLGEWAKELLAGETMTYVGDTIDRSMLKWHGKKTPRYHP